MLFERRPANGLLGGMLGLPGTELAPSLQKNVFASAPAGAKWEKAGEVAHTFTHFHLALDVYTGIAPKGFRKSPGQQWIAPEEARLPTAMRKAVSAVQGTTRASDRVGRRSLDVAASPRRAVGRRNDRRQWP